VAPPGGRRAAPQLITSHTTRCDLLTNKHQNQNKRWIFRGETLVPHLDVSCDVKRIGDVQKRDGK